MRKVLGVASLFALAVMLAPAAAAQAAQQAAPAVEISVRAELLRDGRGYSTRQVRGFQNGKPVYVCLASFAGGEPSGSFEATMPAGIPDPETLPTSAAYLADRTGGKHRARRKMLNGAADLNVRAPEQGDHAAEDSSPCGKQDIREGRSKLFRHGRCDLSRCCERIQRLPLSRRTVPGKPLLR